MAVHIGLAEGSKEISEIYLGAEESVKEISDAYIGNAGGSLQQIYTSYVAEPGQQVFTTSGTFTVPKGVKSVDVFLVGGGGAGGGVYQTTFDDYPHGYNCTTILWIYGNGGGGGYTKTVKNIAVKPGKEYNITIGAGDAFDTNNQTNITYGGTTRALGYSASGGQRGVNTGYGQATGTETIPKVYCTRYGNGGSGGGQGGWYHNNPWYSNSIGYGGDGGSDGSNGYECFSSTWSTRLCTDIKGQGTTTRAFGKSSGTLYAGGGGGAGHTVGGRGGAGGGLGYNGHNDNSGTGGGGCRGYSGGSGCVIVRWGY